MLRVTQKVTGVNLNSNKLAPEMGCFGFFEKRGMVVEGKGSAASLTGFQSQFYHC